MKLTTTQTLQSLAEFLGCSFIGDPNHQVTGINEIHKVVTGDLVFVDHPKYYEVALNSAATTILINKEVDCPEGKGLLLSEDPFSDYNKLTRHFAPFTPMSSAISESATIGEGTIIQPNVSIGNRVTVGKNCLLEPGVVIYDDCVIGDNVILHANVTIGGDAFYFQKRQGKFERMHSCGRVVLENDVEIGCGSTIDRGVSGDTVLGEGTKLDNLVHIGHDTVIGSHCLFAAQVGVAGCVVVEDHVTMWGQAGVAANVTIGEGAVIGAKSGVSKSLAGGKVYFGAPAVEMRQKHKEMAALRKLPEIIENL